MPHLVANGPAVAAEIKVLPLPGAAAAAADADADTPARKGGIERGSADAQQARAARPAAKTISASLKFRDFKAKTRGGICL